MHPLERLLLTNNKFSAEEIQTQVSLDENIVRLCDELLNKGRYWPVLQQQMEQFRTDTSWKTDLNQYYENLRNAITEQWEDATPNDVSVQWKLMLCGITALQIFVQANFTGPTIKRSSVPVTHFLPPHNEDNDSEEQLTEEQLAKLQQFAVSSLSIGGELVYAHVELPHYLMLARIFLTQNSEAMGLETYDWWTARYCNVHQSILSHAVQPLLQMSRDAFDRLRGKFASLQWPDDEISGRFHLEEGIMYHSVSDNKNSKLCFQKAKDATGLQVELTGAMGTRTKYQVEKKAQLVVRATSRISSVGDDQDKDKEQQPTPVVVPMDEDVHLLEKIKLDDDEIEQNLRTVDQAILLSLCLDVKNNNPNHGLTTEEMMPYVTRSLEHSNNWMVHTMGLLLKSRLEKESSRTAERSVLQLQTLVEQYNDELPDVTERMMFIYCLAFPPMFDLKRELGLRLMGIGAVRSALDWFERLEMWEEIIHCHMAMENEKRAQRVVEERLEVDPNSPMLLCLYGDITKDPAHYEKAWEVSNNRFARAKRSLGSYYYNNQNFEKSIEHYTTALELSPLYPHSWFILGVSAMKIERWDTALTAFTHIVQQEPDDGETWCNIASIYMQQREFRKAFRALQEALKHKYLNWKIWENFLYVAMNLQEFQSAIYAVNRLLQLRSEKEVNSEVLLALVKAMHIMLKRDPESGEVMKERLAVLFENVTDRISLDPDVWDAYAFYYQALGDTVRMIDMRQKHVRTLQVSGWDRETSKFKCVVNAIDYLVDAQLEAAADTLDISQKRLYYSSAMLMLNPAIKRTEQVFKGTEPHDILVKLLQRAEYAMNRLNAVQQ